MIFETHRTLAYLLRAISCELGENPEGKSTNETASDVLIAIAKELKIELKPFRVSKKETKYFIDVTSIASQFPQNRVTNKTNKCPECEGTGKVEVVDKYRIHSQIIDIPYRKVECPKCEGTGEVEDTEEKILKERKMKWRQQF